jgi:hypothetical protein
MRHVYSVGQTMESCARCCFEQNCTASHHNGLSWEVSTNSLHRLCAVVSAPKVPHRRFEQHVTERLFGKLHCMRSFLSCTCTFTFTQQRLLSSFCDGINTYTLKEQLCHAKRSQAAAPVVRALASSLVDGIVRASTQNYINSEAADCAPESQTSSCQKLSGA